MRVLLPVISVLASVACGSPTVVAGTCAPATSSGASASAPATGALTIGTVMTLRQGDMHAYVLVYEPGDVVARRGQGTTVLGTRHVEDSADPEDPTLEEYVILAEGAPPFATLTLVGRGSCTTRVTRQLETSMSYLAPDGTRTPSGDDPATLLEVDACPTLGDTQRALGGRPVVFHAFALPGDRATPAMEAVVAPFEEMARRATGTTTARPLEALPFVSRADTLAVLGDHLCIVRAGTVVLDYDGWIWGEVVAGDRTFLVMDSTSDGLELRDVDELTPVTAP